jgi:hypothetical protein
MRTFMALGLVASLGSALLAGCSDEAAEDAEDGVEGKADGVVVKGLSIKRVRTQPIFDAIAFADDGLIVLGESIKFLIDNRVKTAPDIFFMNANFKDGAGNTPDSARFHFFFAQAVLANFTDDLGAFNHKTYDIADKDYVAGTIQVYKVGGEITYGIQFYPQDVIKEDGIVSAVSVVQKAFTIPNAHLAFVATGPQQTATTIDKPLADLGIANSTIEKILGSLNYLPMNLGEAWGFVVQGKADDELTPRDIPIFSDLPLDLAVVAGTITTAFQDASAHINLKSKERGTPNMVLRDASTNPDLKPFINNPDMPVHLVIAVDGPHYLKATKADVDKAFNDQRDRKVVCKPGEPPQSLCSLEFEPATELLSFADMCPSDASRCIDLQRAYGSKSANLGGLTNPSFLGTVATGGLSSQKPFAYDLVPKGFGIPIQMYKEFIAVPANQPVLDLIADLIAAERAGTMSQADRVAKVAAIQAAFYKAQLPDGLVDRVTTRLGEVLPGIRKMKFRSSANAEDLPNFDGAGLYDSFSVDLKATDNADGSCTVVADTNVDTKLALMPKTVGCAIKAVYASVWNKRAIEERSFAHLDQETAAMGISVVPSYDLAADIVANAVVTTRVIGSTAVFGYTIASQKDDNLVTNPEPGTLAESTVAAFIAPEPTVPGSFIVTRFATPVAGQPPLTQKVMTDDQLAQIVQITKTVETAYCKVKPDYYDNDCTFVSVDRHKPKSLDFEFKLLANGQFVVKQFREWAGK